MNKTAMNIIVLATGLLAACSPSRSSTSQINNTLAIRMGKSAETTDPVSRSTVAIISGNMEVVCSGTLLADNIVVTAAHCIPDKLPMSVVFSQSVTKVSAYRPIDGQIVNPDYIEAIEDASGNIIADRADIAVVHYKGDTPDEYIPAQLLTDLTVLKPDTYALIAGFGTADDFPVLTSERNWPSNFIGSGTGLLRYARIMIENSKYTSTEVSLDQSWGRGACQGDSGGPAYYVENKKLLLWGVASYGAARAKKSGCLKNVVYTLILPHLSFINRAATVLSAQLDHPAGRDGKIRSPL